MDRPDLSVKVRPTEKLTLTDWKARATNAQEILDHQQRLIGQLRDEIETLKDIIRKLEKPALPNEHLNERRD